MIVAIDDAGEDIDLLEGREVIIQLQPDVAAHGIHLTEDRSGIKVRILITGYEHRTAQQAGLALLSPLMKLVLQVLELHAMNKRLYAGLNRLVFCNLPQLLKVGDD